MLSQKKRRLICYIFNVAAIEDVDDLFFISSRKPVGAKHFILFLIFDFFFFFWIDLFLC